MSAKELCAELREWVINHDGMVPPYWKIDEIVSKHPDFATPGDFRKYGLNPLCRLAPYWMEQHRRFLLSGGVWDGGGI